MKFALIDQIKQVLAEQTVASYDRACRKINAVKARLSARHAFTRVYQTNEWGVSEQRDQPFYSGEGSHLPDLVEAYVTAVTAFLSALPTKPDVVDLGCGDFNIGARIRPLCGRYVACDIVGPLIAFNQQKFADLDVDFRCLDVTTAPLPKGDVVFVRQVLQHLSNDKIAKLVATIGRNFRYLVLTEHLPGNPHFVKNLDIRSGGNTRLSRDSGVVLAAPPFNLRFQTETEICSVPYGQDVIRTTVYAF